MHEHASISDIGSARASLAAAVRASGGEPGPLPGREAELAVVDSALAGLSTGHGAILAVYGVPGIGKTRLLHEISVRAQARGFDALRGGGLEMERGRPLGVVTDALDGRLDARRRAQLERCRTHRAVGDALEGMAGQRPVVLVLDDLQWADASSIELVAYLIQHWPPGPVVGAFAYRPAEAAGRLTSAIGLGAGAGRVARLELAPLTAAEADEVLGRELAPPVRRSLHRDSGGNPLYLRELARAARPERGRLAGVAPRVRLVVEHELASLSANAGLLLRGAAVVGEPVDPALAASVAAIDEARLAPALDELVTRGLLHHDGAGRYAFRAPVVSRAVYESAGHGWRIAAHARAASASAARGLPAAQRAPHVERSARRGDTGAVALLERAGEEAMGRAPADAARWFAASLRLLPADAGVDRRRELLLRAAVAHGVAGATARCRKALEDALALMPDRPSPERARTICIVARLRHLIADDDDLRALLTAELAAARDERCAAALALELSVEHRLAHEWDAMTTRARAARGASDRVQRALAAALLAHADAARCVGARHVHDADAIVWALSDEELAGRLEVVEAVGQAHHDLGRHRCARGHLERGLALARATGQDLFVARLLVAVGFVQLALGNLREASDSAQRACALASELGDERLRAPALVLCCAAALRRGELAAAVNAGQVAVDAIEGTRDAPAVSAAHAWLGQALIESGAHEQGRVRILDGCGGPDLASLAPSLRSSVFGALAEAELESDRREEAERWVRAAEGHARERPLAPVIADAHRARATLLLARDASLAARLAMDAASAYSRLEQPVESARAWIVAGRALARAGRRDEALARLRRAHALLEARGALRYRDQASRQLRALGTRIVRNGARHAEAARGSAPLTARQREVAELVTLGHTNRQIADALCVSRKTVETHLAHIFEKLEVSSRTEVAAWWGAAGAGSGALPRDAA